MSDVLYSVVKVAGAPVATGCNKTYYLDDPSATGHNRVWIADGTTHRVCWNNAYGWCIAEFTAENVFVKYFYSNTQVEYANPWDVTNWSTTIEEYTEYNPTVIGSDDPEITVTTETIQDNNYVNPTETKFQVSQTYYASTGLTECPYVPASTIIIGKPIPENIYYIKVGTTYELTTDVVFTKGTTYYTRTYTKSSSTPYVYVAAVVAGDTITPNVYKVADGKITKVITTTTNTRTGSVTKDITQTITKQSDDITEHARYALPDIEAGKIYRFAFVGDFQELGYIKPTALDFNDGENSDNDSDITRGVFKVEAVTNYYELVLGGIDVYQNLYLPLGISKAIYEQDKTKWMSSDVWYKLVNPMLAAQVYYVPTSIIDGVPDGNISPYDRYHMIIDIGIFNDPELLADLVTCVNMLFKAHFGIPTAAQLASYDKVYIPTSYATWMEEQREVNINQFMREHADQYFNTLFKNEYNTVSMENTSLKAKLETYEQMIGDLANQ